MPTLGSDRTLRPKLSWAPEMQPEPGLQPEQALQPEIELKPEMETGAVIEMADHATLQLEVPHSSTEGLLQKAYPSINHLSEYFHSHMNPHPIHCHCLWSRRREESDLNPLQHLLMHGIKCQSDRTLRPCGFAHAIENFTFGEKEARAIAGRLSCLAGGFLRTRLARRSTDVGGLAGGLLRPRPVAICRGRVALPPSSIWSKSTRWEWVEFSLSRSIEASVHSSSRCFREQDSSCSCGTSSGQSLLLEVDWHFLWDGMVGCVCVRGRLQLACDFVMGSHCSS
ncbi:hypothetical protein GGI43DRAFT_55909 [Trichoderma evansii]